MVQRALAQAEIKLSEPAVSTFDDGDKLGLIAILVEDRLMADTTLRNKILAYANNAQQRIPHSKSFVMEVAENESTFRIASVLEKLYFEGIDTKLIDGNPFNDNTQKKDDNQLMGIVLIGNVPIPVVHDDEGRGSPSLYPYTDFYRKGYLFDHVSERFLINEKVSSPTPEVWHGLIIPPAKDPATAKKQLSDYFDKNSQYSAGNPEYAAFEQRLLYANFPEMEKRMNYMDYKNYGRFLSYMEEMIMYRFNKHLLKELVKEVSADMGSPDNPIMDDASIDEMYDVHTESLFRKFAYNLAEALKVYRSGINGVIQKTGRWTPSQVDSPESLITLRDEYGKNQIKRKQMMLEKETDDFIKENTSAATRQEEIVTRARLNVKLEVFDLPVDNKTFDFDGYFDGLKTSDITNANQCVIHVGQAKQGGQTRLENNSVLAKANRMYNPATLLTPPSGSSGWSLTETQTYKLYGSCVFNNSMTLEATGTHPGRCLPEMAFDSIFDILGSIEISAEEAVALNDRCNVERMFFKLPSVLLYGAKAAEGVIMVQNIDESMADVINQAYALLPDEKTATDSITKGSEVVQYMIATGEEIIYEPVSDARITLSLSTQTDSIDTFNAHVEPTNETIRAIKHIGEPRVDPVTGAAKFPQITTPSTPADGKRFVSFGRNGFIQTFQYLNFFRINGNNPGEIVGDLLKKLQDKQKELDQKTSASGSIFWDFLVGNSEIVEPLIWRASSVDQKLAEIIPKYLDRDSFMPTPTYNPRKSPQNKPNGYEVIHVVAEGDHQGYQFGLNRTMQARAPKTGTAKEADGFNAGTGTGGPDLNEGADNGSSLPEGEGNFICGDPNGVEIWEWFEALQCWIDEEILPAAELFKLDNSCSAMMIPPKEEEPDEDLFDAMLASAADFEVDMKRKSLEPGQVEKITVRAVNAKGEPVLGYIDTPIRFSLDDPSIGNFSQDEVIIFTGERSVDFTALKTGFATATVTMGNLLPREIKIDVYDPIAIRWAPEEEIKAGRSEFTIGVSLQDSAGRDIVNVNDVLQLAPEQPADGGFENGGRLQLNGGKGEIKFFPAPGKKQITLFSKDDYIDSPPLVIKPAAASATQILLEPPEFIPIGKEAEIKVIAADSFGFPGESFNKTITVRLGEESMAYATLVSPTVTMNKGEGVLKIKGGKETADITLIAEHSELKGAKIRIPLLARVDSADWKKTYPQNLFASFVGFPAGDFTQEDYFGGVHLFSGKTEAVYSFLSAPSPEPMISVTPSHLITTRSSNQKIYSEFPGNHLLLQVFDQKAMRTLISKKIPLNLQTVEKFEGRAPEVGRLYVDILSGDYAAIKYGNGLQIRSFTGNVLATLQPGSLKIADGGFSWLYETEPEFDALEIKLTDGLTVPARIIMKLAPEKIQAEEFTEISPSLKWDTVYGGKSTNDPTGLVFFDRNAEVPEVTRAQFYGFEGLEKYLSLFASGTNVGDAVKFNMPVNAVLLGDPTIKLPTKSSSSLNYNSATGQQIYADPEGKKIVSINHLNFNNDGYQDIVLLTEDGRLRLMEGGATEPPFKDKGNLAFLADGGVAVETFNFNKDNFDDLLVATAEGRLALLKNNSEVITRTDQKLNIGKKIVTLMKGDMDQDGFEDLVIQDSRGDIYIFYYNPATGSFPENGMLIANYGYSLKLGDNLNTDLDILYTGLPEPAQPGKQPGSEVVPPANKASLENYEVGGTINEEAALAFFNKNFEAAKLASKDPTAAVLKSQAVPTLPWPEGDKTETYFAPIESITGLNVIKKISNQDRPGEINVDLEETLTYTIEINSGVNLSNVVIADTVPDALTFLPATVTCVQGGCDAMEVKQSSVKVFFSNLKLTAGQKTVFTYDAFVTHTPKADMFISRISEPNYYLANPGSIIDQYLDLVVSPPYNNTGKYLLHYTTGPQSYAVVQSNDPKPAPKNNALGDFSTLMTQMQAMSDGNYDSKNPPPEPKMGAAVGNAIGAAMGDNDCLEDPNSIVTCAEGVLDDIGAAIAEFSCKGASCFPMPFNMAFLVPPSFPLPAIAFPTTLPTPVGPMPFPSFFGIPSIIGAASIPGPIMSQIRFYTSPTLTGGLGLALCWGPYPMAPVVPPPVWPIPYPPPIGNCMVTATNIIPNDVCDLLEQGMNALVDMISSGVNKVNSTVNEINNNPDLPMSVEQGGPDQGAGGLEISLGVNLGNSQKFEPPAKSFSNTHIPTFDSLGGVISGWFDRQTLEIQNKLLTLPTFSIYLPDIKNLFTLDWQKTEKRFEGWKNVMSGSGSATLTAIGKISDAEPAPGTEGDTLGQTIRGGLQDVSGSKALAYMQAVETQASVYKLNTLEGLYDVASTLPLVKLTEKPIQMDIPWLSAAEIQAWILKAQEWIIYYEREYDRVKDKWEALTCDDLPDPTDATSIGRNRNECMGRHLADMFGTNFDPVINSVKQNIEVLQAWLNFPKDLIKFKQQMADYVRSVACYINNISMMMGGWLAVLQQQMVTWAEVILTIIEIVKNIKELFDIFNNFDDNCSICTNERYANFGWWMLLGLVLPDIPIIQFPKIPDIVLDMSNLDGAIEIELPMLQINPKPLPLPPLPYIRLPDLPTINLMLTLPPLPILPGPPEIPDLPELPPLPTVDLPTLPAPPKLPDVSQAFEVISPLIEKVLEIWCIMKKSLAPVPEQMLNDQITLLTNRPAYLIPLDLMKIQLPNIALFDLGFNELRIETIVYLGLRINLISKPLEEAVKNWNETFFQKWPDTMNQFYQDYIIEMERMAQDKLDEAETAMAGWAADFEADFDKYVQGWIDKEIGEWLAEKDEGLREREAKFQEWADQIEIEADYETYYRGVQKLNETIGKWSGESGQKIQAWFSKNSDWIGWLDPAAKLFQYIDEGTPAEELQKVLDLTAEKLDLFAAMGPTVLVRLYGCLRNWNDCKENEQKYFGSPSADAAGNSNLPPENKMIAQAPIMTDPKTPSVLTEEEYARQILATPQGEEIKAMLTQIAEEIKKVNAGAPVDYTLLKEKLGVPDYVLAPRQTTVDKLRLMEEKLIEHSDRLLAEVNGMKHIRDLNAIAGVPPLEDLPYQLADTETEIKNAESRTFTNALPIHETEKGEALSTEKEIVELRKEVERLTGQQTGTDGTADSTGSCKAAVCLPDPVTNSLVPVIPHIDLINHSETLFLPNGHLVYSDGTGLYLKRDLTVTETKNMDKGAARRFTFDQISKSLWIAEKPKEAVNMLQTVFTENGAATFTWNPSTHPDVYGYGIELERIISGYDAGKKNHPLPDTKIILLPPNPDGMAPEVTANGQPIGYGTLVTSLKDKELAAQKFGVSPRNIVTGADEIRFPTISNAFIKVNENKAVYFDQLSGSAYTMNMENGYYQIKMTWFDEYAGTASYNKNEILAPQIYAGSAEPIDVSQTDTYYTPIFKAKTIRASEIFMDLAGAYQYYWYIDPDNNSMTPQRGETLNIPPQNEEKTFKVKLVATQDIRDGGFKRFEKTFEVNVYTPAINLNAEKLKEGIIAGDMTPIPQALDDDLSDMPFSVFRKRMGTWKNLGILRSENPDKAPTRPPLGENQSYYSINSEGAYHIEGFEIIDPSPMLFKDQHGNALAEVQPDTGLIKLNDPAYDLQAVPAGTKTPTRIAIIKKETGEILGSVYYIADTVNNVTIVNSPLGKANVALSGTTVGDTDLGDDIVAATIPEIGPSFPGGVAIFEKTAQKNIALVDKDGTIRMMQAGYKLDIKNKNSQSDPYIFRIVTDSGKAVFDIFIQADFENLQVDSGTDMNDLSTQIGLLPKKETAYAPLLPGTRTATQSTADMTPVPQFRFEPEEPLQVDGNPFPDVDESHPYFNQILDLYKSRVISGYADGSFKPDQKLTRAEFIKIAMGVTNCLDCTTPNEAIKEKYLTDPFPDVSLPSWFFYCIAMAKELGMVTGYGDGFFRPDNNISRAEAAAVLLRQSNVELTEAPEGAFLDVPDYAWYVDYVYTAVQIGLIQESFGFVNPDEQITRGEFAFMAAGVKNLAMCWAVDTDGDGFPDWWEMIHDMDLFTPDAERFCPCIDSSWTADTDGDGIPDVCDTDIDNDGILNPMCILTDTGEIDPQKLSAGMTEFARRGEPVDNCIFVYNPDQRDTSGDGIGDACSLEFFCPCIDSLWTADTDGDGIPDVCDTDIDGDGVLNPMCILTDTGEIDPQKLAAGMAKFARRGEPVDNCIFVYNPDQLDTSGDGIGDACEIKEKIDLCPEIPEDMDGVDDHDGCPELNDEFPPKDPGVYLSPGELCSFIDFVSDFVEDDIFMTAITDLLTHEVLFSQSTEITYTPVK